MNNLELTKDFLESVERRDFDRVEELMDDNFSLMGPMPTPMSKTDFMEAHRALLAAFSDFKYNYSDLKEVGKTVTGTIQIEAKHTNKLDLSFMQGSFVEATHKKVRMPKEPFIATIINGKVTHIISAPVEGGGFEGMLQAIGAEMPHKEPA